jgi:hypothetical protein
MQPMKPADVHRILNERPDVTLDHIHEYQRLQSELLNVNPRRAMIDTEVSAHTARRTRLAELHQKIFGDVSKDQKPQGE